MNEGSVVAKGSLEALRAEYGDLSLEAMFLQLTARPAQR
jgi:hypothetical protein